MPCQPFKRQPSQSWEANFRRCLLCSWERTSTISSVTIPSHAVNSAATPKTMDNQKIFLSSSTLSRFWIDALFIRLGPWLLAEKIVANYYSPYSICKSSNLESATSSKSAFGTNLSRSLNNLMWPSWTTKAPRQIISFWDFVPWHIWHRLLSTSSSFLKTRTVWSKRSRSLASFKSFWISWTSWPQTSCSNTRRLISRPKELLDISWHLSFTPSDS